MLQTSAATNTSTAAPASRTLTNSCWFAIFLMLRSAACRSITITAMATTAMMVGVYWWRRPWVSR